MIAAQLFNAISWRSFSVVMTRGIIAIMIAMFIPHDGMFDHWFPWAMPSLAVSGSTDDLQNSLTVGIVAFCLIAVLGVRQFIRREHP